MSYAKRVKLGSPAPSQLGSFDGELAIGGEDEPAQTGLTKGSWTKDEDERLLSAVAQFGTEDWNQVKQWVRTRTVKQCKDRYKLKLDPSIVTAPWTRQEDDELLRLSQEHGRSWTKIAKQLAGRTENAVKARIATLERKRQCEWTADDDALLKNLKQRVALGEAISFAQYFPNRTEHSIQKRWDALNGEEIAAQVRRSLLQNSSASPELAEHVPPPQQQKQLPPPPMPTRLAQSPVAATAPPPPAPQQQQQPAQERPVFMFHPTEYQQRAAVHGMPFSQFSGAHRPAMKSPQPPPASAAAATHGKVNEDESGGSGFEGSRLKRQSTSMTVLMQVLSGVHPPAPSPGMSTMFPRRMLSGSSSTGGFLPSVQPSTTMMMSSAMQQQQQQQPQLSSRSLLSGTSATNFLFASPPSSASHTMSKYPSSTLPLTFSSTDISQLQLPTSALTPELDSTTTPGQSFLSSLLHDIEVEKQQHDQQHHEEQQPIM